MKASVRKNLILTLTSAIIALICAFACINFACAKADTPATFVEPAEVTVATKDAGFSVTNGASVRIETAGIKFQTVVTEDYYNSIVSEGSTIEFFAVAKKVGGTAYKVRFAQQPDFTDSTSFELNTYLNFNEYQTANKDNASALDTAYNTKFAIDTYAAVTKSDVTTYYKAYQGENNSRTMREVAAIAYANKVEGYEGLSQYFTKVITSENVAELLNATSGYYILGEDINMETAYTDNGGVWASTVTFNGTLDGAGHTISNFKTTSGIFKTLGTQAGGPITIKNIAFVDVAQVTAQVGPLADNITRNCNLASPIIIDNVYVAHSKAPTNMGGGLFGRLGSIGSTTVQITNTYANVNAAGTYGALAYDMKDVSKLSIENSYFVGPVLITDPTGTIPETGYALYANTTELAEAILADEVTGLSDFVYNLVAKNAAITLINSSNISTLLSATSGTFVLTEDIDMATAYTDNGGVWASTVSFNGSINGLNHTISNFKTSTGLFKQLGSGAGLVEIKNLAFVDAQVTDQVGTLAKTVAVNGGLTINIDNIYIGHSVAPSWGGGGILGRSPRLGSGGTTMNITNTVVYINGADGGSYGTVAHTFNDTYGLTFDNCYFIGANGTVVSKANVAIPTTGYAAFVNYVDFLDAYTYTLSEFIEGVLNIERPQPSPVSDYSIVIANGAAYNYVNAANDLQSFFTNRQA